MTQAQTQGHNLINRPEMEDALLDLGGAPIELVEYATTGILGLVVGPRGCGKTNAALLIAEQLSEQGWVSVLIDPEDELESLYGRAVASPDILAERLMQRDQPIVVVRVTSPEEFAEYGRVISEAADRLRKPILVMIDESQLFSSNRLRKEGMGVTTDIINDWVGRGRKRAVDLIVTSLRYSGTLHRHIFANKNLTLIGCQEDPAIWSALAPQFRNSGLDFSDFNSLAPTEFFCMSRRGIEKVRVPMAQALKRANAPRAKSVKRTLPASFSQWARAMSEIPTERLHDLNDPALVDLLGSVAGLTAAQMLQGHEALADEIEVRRAA